MVYHVTSLASLITGLKWRYTVSPIGLTNSPAAMILVLMTIFSPLVSQGIAYVYMDDISTAAKTWSEAIEKLELVLQIIESNNLSCQPQKSSFCFSSIKLLGYEISKDGLRITDEKIKIIKALKVHHDKK